MELGFGYILIRSPYAPYSIYLRGPILVAAIPLALLVIKRGSILRIMYIGVLEVSLRNSQHTLKENSCSGGSAIACGSPSAESNARFQACSAWHLPMKDSPLQNNSQTPGDRLTASSKTHPR